MCVLVIETKTSLWRGDVEPTTLNTRGNGGDKTNVGGHVLTPQSWKTVSAALASKLTDKRHVETLQLFRIWSFFTWMRFYSDL